MIHITDHQTDTIVGVVTAKNILNNNHHQSLLDYIETFEFTTFADRTFSPYLSKRNRIIIPSEDEGYIEFIITESIKYRDNDNLKIEVYSYASYQDLKKAKVIKPTTLKEYTPSTAVSFALGGTEWQSGIVEGKGFRTIDIENHTDPFSLLKKIAKEFELELRFRVETNGNKVTGRFVDLLERVGKWSGREVEFGRDLLGIRRIEKTNNVYTALVGLGPDQEDGTRLEVLVEDEAALERWGRNGKHLIGVYEPQIYDENMSIERLRQLTRTELDKRINEVVEYESDIADLENVPGMENKKIRFGDTIKIKDTKFNPPLYLEARIHTQDRSITDKSQKRVTLGDYIEYTEEEIDDIWKSLQAEISKKASMAQVMSYDTDSTGQVVAIKKWTGSSWENTKMTADVLSVKELSALSADLGHVTAGLLDAVEIKGVHGTFGRVSVKDDNLFLKDSVSGMESHAIFKTNLLKDHSFESLAIDENAFHGRDIYNAVSNAPNSWSGWMIDIGNARLLSLAGAGDLVQGRTIFGYQSLITNNQNYVFQDVMMSGGQQFTVSFHTKKVPAYAAGRPRLSFKYFDEEQNVIDQKYFTFDQVVSETEAVRYSATDTTPPGTYLVRIYPYAADTGWVMIDGIQMVLGDTPSMYDSEDSLTQLMYGFQRGKRLFADEFEARKISFQDRSSIDFDIYGNIAAKISAVPNAYWNIKNSLGKVIFKVPFGSNYENVDTVPLSLRNGWVSYGGIYRPVVARKDPAGYVYLEGAVRHGSGEITTLPTGYRPKGDMILIVPGNNGSTDTMARVNITSTGIIRYLNGGTNFISLDNISFYAGW